MPRHKQVLSSLSHPTGHAKPAEPSPLPRPLTNPWQTPTNPINTPPPPNPSSPLFSLQPLHGQQGLTWQPLCFFCRSFFELLVFSSRQTGLLRYQASQETQAPSTSGLAIASIEGNNNLGLMFTNDLDHSLVISQLALNRLAPFFRFCQTGVLTPQDL